MRKGLSLIELILSMVIIGIVFTVIPRLVMAMNQGTKTTVQEEAMYNALTRIGEIINLPWDQNNTQNPQILSVTNGNSAYDCNATSRYRIGGFVGGRNCIGSGSYAAQTIGSDSGDANDIDDFADSNLTAEKNCSGGVVKGLYTIATSVSYMSDPLPGGDATLSAVSLGAGQTSNTKRITVHVGYGSDSQHKGCIGELSYDAFNLGHIQINSRGW